MATAKRNQLELKADTDAEGADMDRHTWINLVQLCHTLFYSSALSLTHTSDRERKGHACTLIKHCIWTTLSDN